MRSLAVFAFVTAVLVASISGDVSPRIFGGTVTTIDRYPHMVSMQTFMNGNFLHQCGGTIINNRSILTAAHCFITSQQASSWRCRVGSSFWNNGGTLHNFAQIINHPNFIPPAVNVDIGIVRIVGSFQMVPNFVQQGQIAGPNFNVPDNQPVWAIGFGVTEQFTLSQQLRHVQLFSISQNQCISLWSASIINDSMMCAGRLDQDGFGQCSADSGGPVLYNFMGSNVVVGVTSFGSGVCGSRLRPVVNARVSFVSNWVQANA